MALCTGWLCPAEEALGEAAGPARRPAGWAGYSTGGPATCWCICSICGAQLKWKRREKRSSKLAQPGSSGARRAQARGAPASAKYAGQNVASLLAQQYTKENVGAKLDSIARWLIGRNLPLQAVEAPSSRRMAKAHCPAAEGHCGEAIKGAALRYYKELRDFAKSRLKGQIVCLTMGHWASRQHASYSGMTAHWVDGEYELQPVPLGMWEFSGRCDADHLADDYFARIETEIGEVAEVFAITADTDGKMDAFGRMLKKKGKAG